MEKTERTSTNYFSLKNRDTWSDNRFTWFYATLIFIAVVVFAIILKTANIYESMAWRVVNFFFILVGFVLMVKDYKKHKDFNLSYTQALLLCFRTGFYFALLFLPALAFVVNGYPTEQAIMDKDELYNSQFPIFEIVFANYVETIASILICSFAGAFFVGLGGSSTKKNN
ncbi:hypothetical protein [Bizionia arctica]|uniref:DUF4199 domain-containing protein n=1 Tax=Bizionia arctica TaxID=1495645 RepID=A0A917GKA3_9FLAO|nr:hypothetical protein [Bizionia arctica]GGG49108.1 hypothetical protein GCM10010976_20550 [Bizionia arctica]